MADCFNSVIFYYFLWIFNFCETTYNSIKDYFTRTVNKQLEGRVLYYAMYSKGTQGLYYTQLYNFTSIYERLKIIFLSNVYKNYYEDNSIFTYNEVHSNIDNLTGFMIDAVIVSYVKEGQLDTKILTYKNTEQETSTSVTPKLIYALVISSNDLEYDFTKELNHHLEDITGSLLEVKDLVHIINKKYHKNVVDENNIMLKIMFDNDFTERLLNNNDKILV